MTFPATDNQRAFIRQVLFDNGMDMPVLELAADYVAAGHDDFAGTLASLLRDGDVRMSMNADRVILNV